jgi:hypothetical protein
MLQAVFLVGDNGGRRGFSEMAVARSLFAFARIPCSLMQGALFKDLPDS